MAGVTSNLAARSIRDACARKSEGPLSPEALRSFESVPAALRTDPGDPTILEMLVTINNNTAYTITEFDFIITDLTTNINYRYTIRNFPDVLPGGASVIPPEISGPIGAGAKMFYFVVEEKSADVKNWSNEYKWRIDAVKGYKE
jgi:hypothetical protein